MARNKRTLAGQDIKPMTIKIRASVHDKLSALAGPSGSLVETIEKMTEYLFERRMRRIEREQHNEN